MSTTTVARRESGTASADGSSVAPASASTARSVLALARVEAIQLLRSPLVLVGLLGSFLLVHQFLGHTQPLWWRADWEIGYGQVTLAATVLAAAQLAAGRSRRDHLEDVFDGLPVSAGTRTVGHLIALLGALPASLLLLGASTLVVDLAHPVGRPDLTVLAGGVLLVLGAGAFGVGLGRRFPHPLAGLVGALVWLVPFTQSNRMSGAQIWVWPWTDVGWLSELPNRLAAYPPALAHLGELAAIVAFGVVAAVAAGAKDKTLGLRAGLLATAALSVAVIVATIGVELQPIPTNDVSRLVAQVAQPVSYQRCTTSGAARICLYPSFASLLSPVESAVDPVLAAVPGRPGAALTIAQTVQLGLDLTLTHGQSAAQVAQWKTQLQQAPGASPSGSPGASPSGSAGASPSGSALYLVVGSWPVGGQVVAARFEVALGAADWAVGLPLPYRDPNQACVAFDQAREAIAIWLAIQAVHPPPNDLRSGLSTGGRATPGSGSGSGPGGPPGRLNLLNVDN
ncbi:MAG: hypothetical protein ACRDZ8_16375, partial [Acidimicrobiales bacterium]